MRKPNPERTDADAPELGDEFFARARPAAEVLGDAFMERARNVGGRPRQDVTKPSVTMRLDVDVLDHLRGTGRGWQTRVNDALRGLIEAGKI